MCNNKAKPSASPNHRTNADAFLRLSYAFLPVLLIPQASPYHSPDIPTEIIVSSFILSISPYRKLFFIFLNQTWHEKHFTSKSSISTSHTWHTAGSSHTVVACPVWYQNGADVEGSKSFSHLKKKR
jgi:hypothetical protein